jgi:hypothetical protein
MNIITRDKTRAQLLCTQQSAPPNTFPSLLPTVLASLKHTSLPEEVAGAAWKFQNRKTF